VLLTQPAVTQPAEGERLEKLKTDAGGDSQIAVALLTGGADKPYALGLANALISQGVAFDLIGSDDLDLPEFRGKPGVNLLNLRGEQSSNASFFKKLSRVAVYYGRLIRYSAKAKPRLFHILWNNKFEFFDRTLLMLYYRWLGKRVLITVHNVNAGRRDANDSPLNRLTLRIQYRLADHLFVHTEKMKTELSEDLEVPANRITVIPFGINNTVPNTCLTPSEARQRLGIRAGDKAILFFGHIAPYKGLEDLVSAFERLPEPSNYRLIIAGRPKNCERYWTPIHERLSRYVQSGRVVLKAEFIPDDETELYFKAADVLVLPYRHIYQSGVLFLGQSFGLPVLAADVGSLSEDISEGKTGFVFRPEDPQDLAMTVGKYFASDLYKELNTRRREIREYAAAEHSWEVVGQATKSVYAGLLRTPGAGPSRS
jgi:D-inositol-3-phosphate glycosyltransferase